MVRHLVAVVLDRKIPGYSIGETAGFSRDQAETMVRNGSAHYPSKEELTEDDGESGKPDRRNRMVDTSDDSDGPPKQRSKVVTK